MLSANRTCLLYGNVLKIKIFTWINANKWAMGAISMLGVCQCVKSGFFVFWVMNQSERTIKTKQKKEVKVVPPN